MKEEILKKVPLFAELDKLELSHLAGVAFQKTYLKGSFILFEKEMGSTLSVISKGKVKVTVTGEEGKEVILAVLSEGDFFGDLALLDGKPRSASVVAMEETELLNLGRGDFLYELEKNPKLALTILRTLGTRLRKADRQIESLALLDVSGRVARTLLNLASEQGEKTSRGLKIKNRPTHQEIANMSGTTRETVTRVLGDMQKKRLISVEGDDIYLMEGEAFQESYS
jgi:CRP/FNR family cyclic AMP-dependent transcriptional regulator